MKALRLLFVTALWVTLCTSIYSCSKDDNPEQESGNLIEQYSLLLYGSWYRESNSELSKSFMNYKFSSNKSVVRYTKNAVREKATIGGIVSYSDWRVNNEYSTAGIWYIERKYERNYLEIQWDGNDFYSGYPISYLNSNLLNIDDGFSSDLNKGEKSPNF